MLTTSPSPSPSGNTKDGRRGSKKKTLSDYNLYFREQSSQSDDNVETESLISYKDESLSVECLFKPQQETTSSSSSIHKQQQQHVDNTVDDDSNDNKFHLNHHDETQTNNLTRLVSTAGHCIVDVEKENGKDGRQVFSTKNNKKKIDSENTEQDVVLEEEKKERTIDGRKNKRFRRNSKQKGELVVVVGRDSLTDRGVKYTTVSSDGNDDVKKGKKTKRMSKNKNDGDISVEASGCGSGGGALLSDEGLAVKRRASSTSSAFSKTNLSDTPSNILSPDNSVPATRVDQFNKVCPSPFTNAPGFQRTYSVQYKQSKPSTDPFSPKLSKSSSLDTSGRHSSMSDAVVGREKWIQFEEEKHQDTSEESGWVAFESTEEVLSSADDGLMKHDELEEDEEELIKDPNQEKEESRVEGKLKKSSTLVKSMDNLADVVNRTVSLLKGALSNQDEDENSLVSSSPLDRSSSDISDEIISIEFDTDEEKLRDTPVKQFPDVSLFQVTVVGSNRDDLKLVLNKDMNGQKSENKTDNDRNNVLDEYPPSVTRNSWKFWFRYPDKKRRLGTRKWIPVTVHVENDFLKVNSLNGSTPEIRKEIPLHPFYNFTVPILHKGNKDGRVHSVKLQYVKYKEKRRIKSKVAIEHVPVYTPVVKLSCRDVVALREFMMRVESIIRHIPTHRAKGIAYDQEEIFIDSEDECTFLISSDGCILKYNISVQLRLRCFVTGSPQLKLFLNDINNREILSRTKEALVRETGKTTSHWINPELYEYNQCVDINKSNEEGGIVFTPPDGCSFELLRFRLRQRNPLPIVVNTSLEVLALNCVHLKAELRVKGDAKNIRHKRNDVILYIPVPSSWSKLFLKPQLVGRTAKYLSVKSSLKSNLPAKASNTRATLEISAGSACYEPAYGAIVWELGTLPIVKDGLAADAAHTFKCLLDLPFPIHIRDDFQPYSYLEFNVKQQMGSNVSVEEILLSDGRIPEKWVCYRSNYMYKVQMRVLEDGKERTKSE